MPTARTRLDPWRERVRDATILLNALAGSDPRDSATAGSNGKIASDYTQFLDPHGLHGARIGVARKYFGFSDSVDSLMNEVMEEMKRQGAVLVDPADLESHGKFGDSEFLVLLYELKADLNAYLAGRPDAAVHSLKDVIEFNERNKDKEMPYFLQDIFIKAEEKGPLTSKEYLDALEANHRLSRAEGIDGVMDKFHLDAIMAPTGGPAWITDLVNGDRSGRGKRERRSGGGISGYHGAGRLHLGAAGWGVVLRAGLERAGSSENCLRIRAGNQSPQAAPLLAYCSSTAEMQKA